MEWYYAENGTQLGPLSEGEFEQLILSGRIRSQTLVWRQGMERWRPLAEVRAAGGPAALPVGMGGPVSGAYPGGEFAGAAAMPYAGFWVRFAAKFVDNLILNALLFVPIFIIVLVLAFAGKLPKDPAEFKELEGQMASIEVLLQLASSLLWLVADGIYKTVMIGRYGATLGKMVFRLKVVRADGGTVSYGQAAGRFLAEILSGCPTLLIGYVMAAFDSQKRALHDMLCGTRVIQKT